MKLVIVTGACLAAFAAACASAPPPTARLASSEAAVRAAEELRADNTPAAQLHLKLARDQLGEAKRLMANGDNERAEYVLLRAQSDADVAVALAREAASRQQATVAIDQLRKARSTPMPSSETMTTGAQVPTPNAAPNAVPSAAPPPAPAPSPAPSTAPTTAPNRGTVPDTTVPPSVGR